MVNNEYLDEFYRDIGTSKRDKPISYGEMRDMRSSFLTGTDVEDLAYIYKCSKGTVNAILYGCYKWYKADCPEDLKVKIIKWHGGGRPVEPEDLDEDTKDWIVNHPEEKWDFSFIDYDYDEEYLSDEISEYDDI